MMQRLATFFWGMSMLAVFSLNGCMSVPDLQARQETAAFAAPKGHERKIIRTQIFDLLSYVPAIRTTSSEMNVYIEGDGFAWATRNRPSDDPTPITPTVLSLMTASNHTNTAYLARPCQFVGATSRGCLSDFWTSARYSDPVIAALDEALTHIRDTHDVEHFKLIGYSGGGTVALLLAARRADVSAVITLAAPLDIDAFTKHHDVTPMTASLNPVDVAPRLTDIPQVHLIGKEDEIVPSSLAQHYLDALNNRDCVQILTVDATHSSGWTAINPNPGDLSPICKAHSQ